MKRLKKQKADERVIAETNRIYKIGYLILVLGILVDLYLQIADSGMGEAQFRPVELGTLVLANAVCLVMMVRRGLSDDDRYAEADVFPRKHYALVSLAAGAGSAALFLVIRMVAFPYWEFGTKTFILVMGICFLSILLTTAITVYLLQYVVFRLAKNRRAREQEEDDMKL